MSEILSAQVRALPWSDGLRNRRGVGKQATFDPKMGWAVAVSPSNVVFTRADGGLRRPRSRRR